MVLVSGGFDPLHVGHVRYLQEASKFGRLTVALNSDDWLKRKKGYAFMPWDERKAILEAVTGVYEVIPVDDSDGTVISAIKALKPEIFAKGGDRNPLNCAEYAVCQSLGVHFISGIGGTDKPQSSSWLVNRQWGFYNVLSQGPGYKVKKLTVMPGKATSVQRHAERLEVWCFPNRGDIQVIPAGKTHQLKNETQSPLEVIEVQMGDYCGEDDIVRIGD